MDKVVREVSAASVFTVTTNGNADEQLFTSTSMDSAVRFACRAANERLTDGSPRFGCVSVHAETRDGYIRVFHQNNESTEAA